MFDKLQAGSTTVELLSLDPSLIEVAECPLYAREPDEVVGLAPGQDLTPPHKPGEPCATPSRELAFRCGEGEPRREQ